MIDQIEEIKRQAELAAEVLQDKSTDPMWDKERALVAAWELLQQVVVLEEGAEPQVGDVLRLYFFTPEEDDKAGAVMTGFYAGGREAITWFRNPRDGSIDRETHKIDDHLYQIIQRNGKAVIYQRGTK